MSKSNQQSLCWLIFGSSFTWTFPSSSMWTGSATIHWHVELLPVIHMLLLSISGFPPTVPRMYANLILNFSSPLINLEKN